MFRRASARQKFRDTAKTAATAVVPCPSVLQQSQSVALSFVAALVQRGMLRRLDSPRLVALLVYALAVHALVWSIGAANARGTAGHVWCGTSVERSEIPAAPGGVSLDGAACQLACGGAAAIAMVARPYAHAMAGHHAHAVRHDIVKATVRIAAQPRGPPAARTLETQTA